MSSDPSPRGAAVAGAGDGGYVGRRRAPSPAEQTPPTVPATTDRPLVLSTRRPVMDPRTPRTTRTSPDPRTNPDPRIRRAAEPVLADRTWRTPAPLVEPAPRPEPAPAPSPGPPRSDGHAASRSRSAFGGVTLPATAAAALSLVATGAGVVGSLGGTAAAAGRTPRTDASGSATTELTTVRTADDAGPEAVQVVQAQRAAAALRASRDEQRAAYALTVKKRVEQEHRWVLPVVHYVKTSGFGMRWGKLHAGEDFAAPIGTPVHAISAGVVVFAGVENGYGNKIELRHWDGTCSWYGHLSKIGVKVGQHVTSDQLIGAVGDTGHSTGPHLHLEIHPHGGKPVDPLPWLRAHGLKP